MRTTWRLAAVGLSCSLAALMGVALQAAPQAGQEQLSAEIEKAWAAGDFPRLGKLSKALLDSLPDPDNAESAFPLTGLAASELAGGRNAEAFRHFRLAFTNLIQDSCRKQTAYFQQAWGMSALFLSEAPRNRIPVFRGLMEDILASLESSPPSDVNDLTEMTRGVIIAIASTLSFRCLTDGDIAGAAAWADKAVALAPPVEPDRKTLQGEYSCGCIYFRYTDFIPSPQGGGAFLGLARDDVFRMSRVLCLHPQRAMALWAACSADLASGDKAKLRQRAYDIEDLLDRSAPTGSLRRSEMIQEALAKTLDAVRARFPEFWPAPALESGQATLAEADARPDVGKGRAFVDTKKWKESRDGFKGTSYYVRVEALVPAAEDGQLPTGRWWVYRVVDGRLRIFGKVEYNVTGPPKRAGTSLEFTTIERLAEGPRFSGVFNTERDAGAKGQAEALAASLSPCYISRRLIDPDYEGLLPHRRQLFLDGLPWVGMPARLLRLNTRFVRGEDPERSLHRFMELDGRPGGWAPGEEFTIADYLWSVKIRDRRVVAVTAH